MSVVPGLAAHKRDECTSFRSLKIQGSGHPDFALYAARQLPDILARGVQLPECGDRGGQVARGRCMLSGIASLGDQVPTGLIDWHQLPSWCAGIDGRH